MLTALAAGVLDAQVLADMAQGLLRKKIPQLEQALVGCVGAHHTFMIAQHLRQIAALEATLDHVNAEIAVRVQPFEDIIARLDTIPGIGRQIAEALVAEIGVAMSRFPSAKHLASWAGMCLGNHESAGKRHTGKTRKGSPWLRALLIQAAHAAARTRDTYLAAPYQRLAARRGKQRAAVAVGHTILVIAYQLLVHQTDYQDLGPRYFDERDRHGVEQRLVRRLERLGFKVALEPHVVK
jgi:transposase